MFYNVILAAGKGERFKDYNYPKPFLKLKKTNLLIKSSESLPSKGRFIFILRKSHVKYLSNFKKLMIKKFKKPKFFFISKTTKGQASTLFTLKNKINVNFPVFVTSTDFCFKNNNKIFRNYVKQKQSIVFTCKPTPEMKNYPNHYGWVRPNKFNDIIKISCKKKIYGNSSKDEVILGAFYFPSFSIFLEAYKKLIKEKNLVNNEYYLDVLMESIRKEKNVKMISVKKFITWGTPLEYEKYKNSNLNS